MMRRWIQLVAALVLPPFAQGARADAVVPSRTIRAHAIITELDVTLSPAAIPNGYARIADVVGQEARIALYPGRPILLDDVGPPALVARNQVVLVRFQAGGLSITTEGRALERGAVGDRVRVMNLASRATLFGQVQGDGSIAVKQ